MLISNKSTQWKINSAYVNVSIPKTHRIKKWKRKSVKKKIGTYYTRIRKFNCKLIVQGRKWAIYLLFAIKCSVVFLNFVEWSQKGILQCSEVLRVVYNQVIFFNEKLRIKNFFKNSNLRDRKFNGRPELDRFSSSASASSSTCTVSDSEETSTSQQKECITIRVTEVFHISFPLNIYFYKFHRIPRK